MQNVVLRGNVYGDLTSAKSVYVIVGGITASAEPFGENGWWNALACEQLIDLSRDAVICPCMPGNGTSWDGLDALSPTSDLPRISISDIADLVAKFVEGVGCVGKVRFVGASFGGLVGLSFATRHAEKVSRLTTISAGLTPDGWGTGCRHLQRELVRGAAALGKVDLGMSWARQLGMLTYRGREELNERFAALTKDDALPPVADYLDHNGRQFAKRFPATTFLLLSDAIDRAGGADLDLTKIEAEVAVVGVPGDLLFPWKLQVDLHRTLRAANVRSSLWKLDSSVGHDAFLVDQSKLGSLLEDSQLFRVDGAEPTPHRFRSLNDEPMRVLNIGLIGCGVVGQGVLQLLESQAKDIAERYNLQFRVTRIAVRNLSKSREYLPNDASLVTSAMDIATAPDVDIVVEVAGGIEAIHPAISAAMAAGKPVVTANKMLVANKLDDLAALSSRMGTPISCEAAAAAAIPIVRTLNHRADDVVALSAIVNGTCNYILTRMEQDEMSLNDAVALAQQGGFAEADPSSDLDGVDAACKLSILAYRCFGCGVSPGDWPVRGIREVTPEDCDLAAQLGFRIRLIARARTEGGTLIGAVEPMLLPDWHLLASVEEEYNAVYLSFARSGDMSLFGKGAGALPTASAVLSDLIDIAEGTITPWPMPKPMAIATSQRTPFLYLRVTAQSHPGIQKKLESHLRRHGLTVTNRSVLKGEENMHLAFVVSGHEDASASQITESLLQLSRVTSAVTFRVAK